METTNYMQIAEQTHEEKIKMYMKFPKKKLVEMLIECNRILGEITPHLVEEPDNPNETACPIGTAPRYTTTTGNN